MDGQMDGQMDGWMDDYVTGDCCICLRCFIGR